MRTFSRTFFRHWILAAKLSVSSSARVRCILRIWWWGTDDHRWWRLWWPSPWGAQDQRGANNRMTPAKALEAAKLVKTGKVYQLGYVLEKGIPLFGERLLLVPR